MHMKSLLLSGLVAIVASFAMSSVGVAQTVSPQPHLVPMLSPGQATPAAIVVCNRCVWHPEDQSWHCKKIPCPPVSTPPVPKH